MIIQQRHFPVCPSVSRENLCTYAKLKGLTARSASTKEYWISAAKKLVRKIYWSFICVDLRIVSEVVKYLHDKLSSF